MDFKKAFISVSVAFLTVIIDIVFKTMYVFPIIIIALLSYFLMKYFEISVSGAKDSVCPESKESIVRCNVEFFKSVVKKMVKDYEKNRFLSGYLSDKVNELAQKRIDFSEVSLKDLSDFFNLKEKLNGKIFAKKGFFEESLKNFFDFLDEEKINYNFSLGFNKDFKCGGMKPVLVDISFPEANLIDRQIGIILTGKIYKGKSKLVAQLFKLREIVEDAGGFFVIFKDEGIRVLFGFSGCPSDE